MSEPRPARWHVMFRNGSLEPIVVEGGYGPQKDLVRLSLRGECRYYEDHPVEIAGGAADLFSELNGARMLIDAETIGRDLATLNARFGGAAVDSRPLVLDRPLAVVDAEATGTDPNTDRMIEFAVVKLWPDGSRSRNSWRINPGVEIPPSSTAVHRITDDDVRFCDPFAAVAQAIAAELEGCDLGGYHVRGYDEPLLRQEFVRAGVPWPCEGACIVDAMVVFKGRERRDLSTAVRWYLGREHVGAHGAMADAEATLDVIVAQVARYADLPRDVEGLDKASGGRQPGWATSDGSIEWDVDGDAVIAFGTRNRGRRLIDADEPLLWWIRERDFSPDTKAMCASVAGGARPRAPWALPVPPQPPRVQRGRRHRRYEDERDEGDDELDECNDSAEGTDAVELAPTAEPVAADGSHEDDIPF